MWNNHNIRYYLLGGGVSRLGDVLSGMAFLFMAYDITNSKGLTTGIALAETLPYLLFGLIGGVVADWLPKKKWLIILDLIRIPLIFSVVCFYYFELLSYFYLLVVSFLIQSIGCFFNPTHRTVLPLVSSTEERTTANSLNDTLARGVTVLSPFISVWLLNQYGAIHFFTVDAFTYAISAYCISKVNLKETPPKIEKSIKSVFLSIYEFATWAKSHVEIRKLFLFTFMIVFLNTWVWEVGLLLALSEMSSESEQLYSMMQGIFGGVVILTNIVLPFFLKRMSLRMYLVGALIWGLGISYYGFLYDIHHFFIGCAIVGIGLPIAGQARVYLIQTLVPEGKLGRAFSSNAFLLYLSNTISLAMYGLLVSFIPIQWLMTFSGLLILLTGGFGLWITVKRTKMRWRFSINFLK
ncbi:MFS transporter [Salinibacillus xinjiangensis]|uniref:MFS transporter n=2 Tax=Salinibacillus xinjiangensis TaxID=1229268 RepID=A0A6G1X506_9BACI|nr:MFS transporter [Salinibacillus xinjiangensis]